MNDEEEHNFRVVCRCVTLAVCTLIVSAAGCTCNTNYQIGQVLLKGVEPIQVSCAFDNNSNTACAIVASRGQHHE